MRRSILLALLLLVLPPDVAFAQRTFPGGTPTASGSGTANTLMKFDSAGNAADSLLTDDGSTVTSTVPVALPAGTYAAPALTFAADNANALFSLGGVLAFRGGFNVYHTTSSTTKLLQFGSGDVGYVDIASTGAIRFGDASIGSIDTILARAAAANLRMGAAAANPPVAQTLSMQNASGTDIAGADFTIDGSQGTGTGAGGALVVRSAAAGLTGSSLNALATLLTVGPTNVTLASGGLIFGTTSGIYNDAANLLAQRNGANLQTYEVYSTFTDASNYIKTVIGRSAYWGADQGISVEGLGTGADPNFIIGTRGTGLITIGTNGTGRWRMLAAGDLVTVADNSYDIGAATTTRPKSIHVAAPALTSGSGTGLTVNIASELRRVVHKVTVTYAALAAAATTADKTIATLPAKTRLVGVLADTTTPYTGGGVTAATLIVGKSVGGNEYIVSHDVFSAAILVGDADADLGTSINRASAIQGGDLASWTGTTAISVRLTTTTANTDQLTAGSTTYYLTTESMP